VTLCYCSCVTLFEIGVFQIRIKCHRAIHICVRIYTCTCVCVCVYIYIYIYIYIYVMFFALRKSPVTKYTTRSDIQKLHILPTPCIAVFHVIDSLHRIKRLVSVTHGLFTARYELNI
jgi:hypothetical protein